MEIKQVKDSMIAKYGYNKETTYKGEYYISLFNKINDSQSNFMNVYEINEAYADENDRNVKDTIKALRSEDLNIGVIFTIIPIDNMGFVDYNSIITEVTILENEKSIDVDLLHKIVNLSKITLDLEKFNTNNIQTPSIYKEQSDGSLSKENFI